MSNWLTALVMGLAVSLHCAGMCSPLAMALTRNKPFILSSILYNSGRVLVYALVGTLAAAFGSLFHLAPYQQIISLLLGLAFLFVGFGIGNVRVPYFGVGISYNLIYIK